MALRENVQKIEKQSNDSGDQWNFSSDYDFHPQRSFDSDDMELDLIEQLKFNVFKLGDLQSRLVFMNEELEKVIGSYRKKD